MASQFRSWIILLAGLSLLVTAWLVAKEASAPGHCPPYPGLGVPACYLVFLFFLLVLVSQFIKRSWLNKLVFHVGAIPGLFTAVWFSVHQAKGEIQCPQLVTIPLCYVALATFLSLIILHQVRCIDENTCPATRTG